MSSSRKSRRRNKPKAKPQKKLESGTSSAITQKLEVSSDDDDDDEPKNRKILPFCFRPASIKFQKKRKKTIGKSASCSRSKSLPNIPIADESLEACPPGKLQKLTTLYNIEDVDIIDYRCDTSSEDELLQLWYEESHLEPPVGGSDTEIKQKEKPQYAFADTGGYKLYLDSKIAEPYASDIILRDPRTRPYFDEEFELFKRHCWIQVTHERSILLPPKEPIVFKVLTKNRPRNVLSHLRLGYCVTYAGPCLSGQTCQNRCSNCDICRHQYHCSCRNKKRFGWCWHIHAAVMNGRCKFKEELTVYVSNSSRKMQLAHIRASCYDIQQNVKQVEENLFQVQENSSSEEQVSFMYLVQRLTDRQRCKCLPYKRCPECDICRHIYSCNCFAYEEGNLCEHCHLVAMHLSGCAQSNKKGEFYYLSDDSDVLDEEEQQVPKKKVSHEEQMRQVVMTHERSNSVNLERIEAFLEPPDDMQCYAVYGTNGEEPWFIEDYRREGCDCRDTVEAVVCPGCRLCDHQMKCFCSVPNEYSCKHLHAINRFLKVQFNTDTDAQIYGDETEKMTLDWKLLAVRRKREIKRQKSRNPWLDIQNIDLTWKGEKKLYTEEDISQNKSTTLKHVSKDRAKLEHVSHERSSLSKQVSQNEPSLLNKGSQLDGNNSIDLADSFKQEAENIEMQLAPVYVDNKAVQDDTSKLKTQCAPKSAENLVVRDSSLNFIEEVASARNVSQAKVAENELLKEKIQPAIKIKTTESNRYTFGRLSENDVETDKFERLVTTESAENSDGSNTSLSISENISEKIDTSEKTSAQNEVLEIRMPPVVEFSVELDGETLEHVSKESSTEFDNAESKIQSAIECAEELNDTPGIVSDAGNEVKLEIQPATECASDAESEEIHPDTLEEVSEASDWLESQIHPPVEFPEDFDDNTCHSSSQKPVEIFAKNDTPKELGVDVKLESKAIAESRNGLASNDSLKEISAKNESAVVEKELATQSEVKYHSTESVTQNDKDDPVFAALSKRTTATNEEFESLTASKSTGQLDNGATFEDGFEGVPPENSESTSQASFKSSSESANDTRIEEKLDVEEVIKKIDDLKLETPFHSISTGKSVSNVGKLEMFQPDVPEDSPTVAIVEQKGMKTKSIEDIRPFARNTIEIDEIEVDPGIRAFSNLTELPKADTSTQTDLVDRFDVSTQTSELDFVHEITTDSSSVMGPKKKRKTKTQRKHLKQSMDCDSLSQTSN